MAVSELPLLPIWAMLGLSSSVYSLSSHAHKAQEVSMRRLKLLDHTATAGLSDNNCAVLGQRGKSIESVCGISGKCWVEQ